MNILLVSAHPAQVHNFRIVRQQLIEKGHKVFWATTPKDIATNLLDIYGIEYLLIPKAPKNFWGRVKMMLKNLTLLIPFLLKNKIDIVVDRNEPFITVAAWLTHTHHICLTDTEIETKICAPFYKMSDVVLTPSCFYEPIANQMYFDGNIELFYLHKNKFTPTAPWDLLGIAPDTKYAIVRFVKWDAFHDVNRVGGFPLEKKIELVKRVAKHCKVFISSEEALPEELEPYKIHIPLERMHDVLAFASLVVGESATMASESVVLGTPAIYVDEIGRGYTNEQAQVGLLKMCRPVMDRSKMMNPYNWLTGGIEEAIEAAEEIACDQFDTQQWQAKYKEWLSTKIDCSDFLTWFIDQFPSSMIQMRKDPSIQQQFK